MHVHPALPCPPKREEEEGGHGERRDLARVRVEPARYERGADEGRTEVARGERDPRDPARHACRPALVRW